MHTFYTFKFLYINVVQNTQEDTFYEYFRWSIEDTSDHWNKLNYYFIASFPNKP